MSLLRSYLRFSKGLNCRCNYDVSCADALKGGLDNDFSAQAKCGVMLGEVD